MCMVCVGAPIYFLYSPAERFETDQGFARGVSGLVESIVVAGCGSSEG